ncbi:integrase [Algoriphagus sp. 4150]|uniref:tyrosine-type recombinase/integrase n=1 Tax=Algoriphagus sp. 4150 TaxID=2817756 RepID=UPI002858E1C9|nr:tyrosine-type recombinase/integrase [Algoriphagus sp. 4150]MDR7130704.1 integrase [Algoriphagus sp. 4150]
MKTIFFISKAKAGVNEPNSINLRFYLKSLKKYKVKGIGISCSKSQWNQEEQKVKRSNSYYQKYNNRLNFIENELTKIEEKREVTAADIDNVVKASIKNVDVSQIIGESQIVDQSENLVMLLKLKLKDANIKKLANTTLIILNTAINKIEKFEKYSEYIITTDKLSNNIDQIQDDLVNWCRNIEENKDSSISTFFDVLNTSIKNFNKFNKRKLPTFTQKDNKYKREEKEIIYLTKDELSNLYKFVYAPTEKMQEIPRPKDNEIDYIKYFLFRCFCGMRISEMNNNNINPQRLNPFTKELETKSTLTKNDNSYNYFAIKNNKIVSVPYIGTYLYDIASDLQWNFPDITNRSTSICYMAKEKKVVGETLKKIYGNSIRKITFVENKKFTYKDLSKCISSHTARKSFAYIIYNVNRDLLQVKNCLGHSSIEVTMKYLGIEYDNKSIESFRLDM